MEPSNPRKKNKMECSGPKHGKFLIFLQKKLSQYFRMTAD